MKIELTNTKKKTVALLLLITMLVPTVLSGCQLEQFKTEAKQADVWATNGSEKICRNISYEHPDDSTLTIQMVKNETEGAQLILTATEDIDKYTVSVSELQSEFGVIASEDISIFHEKYMELKEKQGTYEAIPQGSWVPDALLPYQTAVEYGENKVAKGDNQGIYIEVKTTEHTIPGTYQGVITVQADEQTELIPMVVTVSDITLPSISTAKNYWMNDMRHQWASQELDGTDSMAEKYLDTMLEYNMCGALPFDGSKGPEAYAQMVKEYYFKEGFSTYLFYTESKTGVYNGQECYFNVDAFKEYLKAVVKLSVEDEVNYLDKAICYFYKIIDEPSNEEAYLKVKSVYSCYQMVLEETDRELRAELLGNPKAEFYTSVLSETLLNIPNILTVNGKGIRDTLEKIYDVQNITHCPQTSFISSQNDRNYYDNDEEDYWFYTCMVPLYPEVTNHLENDLLGMKIVSWMQYAYDVAGYLNWGAAYHRTDSYNNAKVEGYIAGDGYMFYPGLEYGIEGPVPSLRAVQYRDGIEDYDLLGILEETYLAFGINADAAIQSLFTRVCAGSIPTTSTETYYSVRNDLINMILTTNDEFGVIYGTTTVEQGMATVEFVPTNANASVLYDGKTLKPGDNGMYTVTLDLTKESSVSFTVKTAGGEKEITKKLNEKYFCLTDFEDDDTSLFTVREESAISINKDKQFCIDGSKSMKVNLNGKQIVEEGETYTPYISMNEEFLKKLDIKKVSTLEISIYNASDEPVEFKLQGFTGQRYREISTFTLQSGWNTIRVEGVNLQQEIEQMKALYFLTDNFYREGGIDLYVDAIYYSENVGG